MRPTQRRRQDDLENAFEIVTTKAKPFSKTFEDCVEPSGKAHGIVADLVATEFKPKTDTAFEDFPEIPKAMATVYCYSTRGDLRVGKARAKTFEGEDATEVAKKFFEWFREVTAEKHAYCRHSLKGKPHQ